MELNEIPKDGVVGILCLSSGSPIKCLFDIESMQLLDDNGYTARVEAVIKKDDFFVMTIKYKDGMYQDRRRKATFKA